MKTLPYISGPYIGFFTWRTRPANEDSLMKEMELYGHMLIRLFYFLNLHGINFTLS